MKNLICHSCGTKQSSKNTRCISCGEPIEPRDNDGADYIDRKLYFHSNHFTIAVSVAAYLTPIILIALMILVGMRGTHNVAPLLLPLLWAILGAVFCRFPVFSYRYLIRRRGYREPEDFDDPYPSSLRTVYIAALIHVLLVIIVTAAYFYYIDTFRIVPDVMPDVAVFGSVRIE